MLGLFLRRRPLVEEGQPTLPADRNEAFGRVSMPQQLDEHRSYLQKYFGTVVE